MSINTGTFFTQSSYYVKLFNVLVTISLGRSDLRD